MTMAFRGTSLLRHRRTGDVYVATITGGGGFGPPQPVRVLHAWGPLRRDELADAIQRLSAAGVGPDKNRLPTLLGTRDATAFVGADLSAFEKAQFERPTRL